MGLAVAERWVSWPDDLAASTTPVLVRHAPDAATRLFEELLQAGLEGSARGVAVVRSFSDLPREAGVRLLGLACQTAEGGVPTGPFASELETWLLQAAALLDVGAVRPLTRQFYGDQWSPEQTDGNLARLSRTILAGVGVYEFLVYVYQGDMDRDLAELGPLFRPSAPLGAVDCAARTKAPWEATLALLDETADHSAAAAALALLRAVGPREDPTATGFLACFGLAAVVKAWEAERPDLGGLGLGEVLFLLAFPLDPLPQLENLAARLAELPRAEAAEGLRRILQEDPATGSALHAAEAMGLLGWEELVPELVASLDEEAPDDLAETAQTALVRIGAPAQAYLADHWEELDPSQQVWGSWAVAAVGGPVAAELARRLYPSLCREDLERWCRLAQAEPDRTLLELFRSELRRGQPLIDETSLILCQALGIEDPELDSVRERLARASARTREARDAVAEGRAPRGPLWIPLTCERCGEENYYEVAKVLLGNSASEMLVADEFPYASCGEWADFEVGAMGQVAVMADLMVLSDAKHSGADVEHRVGYATTVFDRKTVSLIEARRLLRELLAKKPRHGPGWFQLAQIEHQANRPRSALAAAERVLGLDPLAAQAAVLKARILAGRGETGEAFDLLRKLLPEALRWTVYYVDPKNFDRFQEEFATLYNELRKAVGGGAPALAALFVKSTRRAAQPPAAQGQKTRKVGRNDPCPCGSGKKYKKCCGAERPEPGRPLVIACPNPLFPEQGPLGRLRPGLSRAHASLCFRASFSIFSNPMNRSNSGSSIR